MASLSSRVVTAVLSVEVEPIEVDHGDLQDRKRSIVQRVLAVGSRQVFTWKRIAIEGRAPRDGSAHLRIVDIREREGFTVAPQQTTQPSEMAGSVGDGEGCRLWKQLILVDGVGRLVGFRHADDARKKEERRVIGIVHRCRH